MAILDTDFLSSFFKIGRLHLILKALDLKHIIIPSTVYEELKETQFFDEIVSLFAFKENELNDNRFILVKHVDLSSSQAEFTEEETIALGEGELGCFILAKKTSDFILIDDHRARTVAQEKSLKTVSLPSFLFYCKRKHIVSSDDLQQIVHDLKAKDYYEFSEDVKKTLLV